MAAADAAVGAPSTGAPPAEVALIGAAGQLPATSRGGCFAGGDSGAGERTVSAIVRDPDCSRLYPQQAAREYPWSAGDAHLALDGAPSRAAIAFCHLIHDREPGAVSNDVPLPERRLVTRESKLTLLVGSRTAGAVITLLHLARWPGTAPVSVVGASSVHLPDAVLPTPWCTVQAQLCAFLPPSGAGGLIDLRRPQTLASGECRNEPATPFGSLHGAPDRVAGQPRHPDVWPIVQRTIVDVAGFRCSFT